MRPIPDQVFPLASGSEGGFILKAYKDPGGKLTIGLGHLCTEEDHYKVGSTITLDHAKDLYRADVSVAAAQVLHLVKVPLNDNQFAALIDFTFNMGSGRLAKSTLLKKLNAGDYVGAADQFCVWTQGRNERTGRMETLPGLVTRRKKEADLFMTPA